MWSFYQSYPVVIVFYQYFWVTGPSVPNMAISLETPGLVCQVGLSLGQVIAYHDLCIGSIHLFYWIGLELLEVVLVHDPGLWSPTGELYNDCSGLGGGSGGGPTAPSLPSLTGSTGGFPRRWATSISSRTSGGWSSRGGHYRRRVSCHQLTQPSPRGSRTHVLTPFVPTAPDRQLSLWGPRSPVWACRW